MADENLIDEEAKSLPKEAKVTYTKSPDYKLVYVNGIYGGLTGKGELRFDFFQEFHPYPEEEIVEITDEGKLGKVIPSEDEEGSKQFELIREKQIGIIMSMGVAQSLFEWLKDKIEIYEKIKPLGGGIGGLDENI